MQEQLGLDHLDARVIRVGVIHQPGLPGFLDIHNPFRLEMGCQDGSHARLRMVLLGIIGVAARADNLERLKGLPVQDDKMGRPVAAHHGIFIPVIAQLAFVLAHFHRAGIIAQLHLGHLVGDFHPQVNHRQPAVAPDHVSIAPGSGHARDVHGVAAVHGLDHLVGIAVDDGHLPGIAQGNDEVILPVPAGLRLGWALLRGNQHLPGFHHLRQRHLRRGGRFNLSGIWPLPRSPPGS